ncbi:peptide ligase PGM1-related protein [Streptomyces sp. NPDC021096]|uniref:preATP grasp domain-containing protein n=1 Tax=Streptomyces sp. NPDC021096 TaxID=3154792 RepID=UPI0033D34500
MVKILVGNDFDEVLRTRSASAWWAQRVMWFADEGDIVVLPSHPERAFLRYVTSMTGTRLESLRVLVPPTDCDGSDTLSGTSLTDERLLAEIRSAIAGRTITSILPLWPGAAIARLARALGVPDALAGHGFIEQGGGALMNSKTAFRAIAAGVGVPVPHGRVCAEEEDAVDAVCELVGAGQTAILKKDYMSGGAGNEIVSPVPGLSPVGAKKVVVASEEGAVRQYLSDRWDWLTDNRRNPFVVERYFPGSAACFAEYLISDAGIEFGGYGEMLSEPVTTKQIIPPTEFSPEILGELTRQGRNLCEPLRAMGYRGRLSADAVITPDGELLFTEYNGRVTGSTHVYSVFGGKIVGREFMKDRVLLEGFWPKGWSVPSFDSAVETLAHAGLAYDRGSRSGVIISSAFDRRDDTLLHCVVAESLTAAYEVEKKLEQCFAG